MGSDGKKRVSLCYCKYSLTGKSGSPLFSYVTVRMLLDPFIYPLPHVQNDVKSSINCVEFLHGLNGL